MWADYPKRHVGGTKPKYNDRYHPEAVYLLALAGKTVEEIAEYFGVTAKTVWEWKKNKKEFREAIEKGRKEPDEKVERSLFEKATGYVTKETKVFYDSQKGEVVTADVEKHYPPSDTAMIFWLKNRRPKSWRDKTDVEISTDGDTPLIQVVLPDNGRKEKS